MTIFWKIFVWFLFNFKYKSIDIFICLQLCFLLIRVVSWSVCGGWWVKQKPLQNSAVQKITRALFTMQDATGRYSFILNYCIRGVILVCHTSSFFVFLAIKRYVFRMNMYWALLEAILIYLDKLHFMQHAFNSWELEKQTLSNFTHKYF